MENNDFETLKSRALVYAEINAIELAIADLDICLRPDANDTAIWMCKGNIYYDAQRFSEAIDAYNVILLLYPDNKAALYNRADAYTSLKRYDEAIRDYQFLSSKDKYNSEKENYTREFTLKLDELNNKKNKEIETIKENHKNEIDRINKNHEIWLIFLFNIWFIKFILCSKCLYKG
jgi:tetratricopeptide (TPR) repeat protein